MDATKRPALLLLAVIMFTGLLGGVPSEHVGGRAEAAVVKTTKAQRLKAMRVALNQRGDRYRYGATGPNAFDCSGLTMYSYRKVGRSIPRTTDGQKAKLRAVKRRNKARGDLIIFVRGGDAYHAGIYVGDNRIVHASRSGTPVKVARIWTSSYVVRRP